MTSFDNTAKQFIRQNIKGLAEDLLLKSNSYRPDNFREIIEQIKLRQKIKEKLPSWYENYDLIIPKSISTEQSSSEITANFKANLVNGNLLLDLTGGMGIDFAAMSQQFKKAIYIDENDELAKTTAHNFEKLGLNNCEFHNGDSLKFLVNFTEKIDWIFIDPARRDTHGTKVFSLNDCSPNLLICKDILLEKAENILIKCSPMLDIELAKKQIGPVLKTYIICIENEVKELLFHLNTQNSTTQLIQIVNNVNGSFKEFEYNIDEEKALQNKIGPAQKYIYEPNAGIMKAGAFKNISAKYNCEKLHLNTHLFTSEKLIPDFPGRTFLLKNILKPSKNELKNHLPSLKANLAVRNFPETTEKLKKSLAIKDGGDQYLFACTDNLNKKIILHTIKIN